MKHAQSKNEQSQRDKTEIPQSIREQSQIMDAEDLEATEEYKRNVQLKNRGDTATDDSTALLSWIGENVKEVRFEIEHAKGNEETTGQSIAHMT
jgi:hypothetical protein